MTEPKTGRTKESGRVREAIRERGRRDGQRRKPRTAFVLSGGGNLGAQHVGMLQALVERGIVPDVVIGCSVGAMNGAGFALDPTSGGVQRLVELWESVADGEMMPSSRMPNAVQMLRKGEAIHGNHRLRGMLETMLGSSRTFDSLTLPFQCNAADIESSMTTWFTDGDLIEPLLASAALPAAYPPVTIDGHVYIDGGVIENVPIGRAVELGCRKIYVLHLGPHGRPAYEIKRPLDAALQAYWVARNSQFARDLASLPEKVHAIVLPPGERPELKHDDFSQTASLIEKGYENAGRFLDNQVDDEGWFGTDILKPIERLVISARSIKWREAARATANSPEGGVMGSDSGSGDSQVESNPRDPSDADATTPAAPESASIDTDSDLDSGSDGSDSSAETASEVSRGTSVG